MTNQNTTDNLLSGIADLLGLNGPKAVTLLETEDMTVRLCKGRDHLIFENREAKTMTVLNVTDEVIDDYEQTVQPAADHLSRMSAQFIDAGLRAQSATALEVARRVLADDEADRVLPELDIDTSDFDAAHDAANIAVEGFIWRQDPERMSIFDISAPIAQVLTGLLDDIADVLSSDDDMAEAFADNSQ